MAGIVAVAAAVSFAPKPIPAVPPPVRLEGAPTTRTDPSQSELVVVPAPSVDLGGEDPVMTSTTVAAESPLPPGTDAPTPGAVADDSVDDRDDPGDDSAGSMDDSADSPDD
jgi:hypothetical protein